MDEVQPMKRRVEFANGAPKPIVVNDSRFGIRRIFINKQERPRIGVYMNPGRGPNGESQN
jgi:hypothetical protein